jgi:hypothetical protein
MQVDEESAVRGDLAQIAHRGSTLGHGALEMRDAAHDLDAEIECSKEEVASTRRAVEPILGEGHELECKIGGDLPLGLEERTHARESRIAHVDVRANGADSLGHGEIAIGQRPLGHGLLGEQGLQLAPESDPLEQGARPVEPGQPQ